MKPIGITRSSPHLLGFLTHCYSNEIKSISLIYGKINSCIVRVIFSHDFAWPIDSLFCIHGNFLFNLSDEEVEWNR
jgi:hypothetical protein